MQLWLLRRKEHTEDCWDEARGFVVRAETERDARELCQKHAGDTVSMDYEGGVSWYGYSDPTFWLDPEKTTCVPLEHAGEPGVVIRDFLYG